MLFIFKTWIIPGSSLQLHWNQIFGLFHLMNFFFLGSSAILNSFDSDDIFDMTFVVRPSTANNISNLWCRCKPNVATTSWFTAENVIFTYDSAGINTGGDTTQWAL